MILLIKKVGLSQTLYISTLSGDLQIKKQSKIKQNRGKIIKKLGLSQRKLIENKNGLKSILSANVKKR